jgi:hypothetical protein
MNVAQPSTSVADHPSAVRRPRCRILTGALLFGWALAPVAAGSLSFASEAKKVVIPFDFVSKFDGGRYGRMVGEMIWQKLEREGGFIIPETMLDVRDTCETNHLHPSPELPLERMQKIVREDFAAQIGIWGSVERVPGHDFDVYDLVIQCVDFSTYPAPKVIYQCKARTKTVSEIPHLYVQEMLDALYGRKPTAPPPADALAEESWTKGPNLLRGDFQRGARGVPAGWDPGWEAGEVGQWEPLGTTVRWVPEAGHPANRLIRFTLNQALGDTTGVAYYSEFFPVEEGAKYRFQCRWRSDGPQAKVFIKCYDRIATKDQPGLGEEVRKTKGGIQHSAFSMQHSASRPAETPSAPRRDRLREVYRSQQNLQGPKHTWNTHTQDFTPKHTQYTPRWGRVMLYAYLGGGVVEFDDVVLKQIVPASPGTSHKDPRRSLGTKVTVKEMEETERRSREGQEKRQREGRQEQER